MRRLTPTTLAGLAGLCLSALAYAGVTNTASLNVVHPKLGDFESAGATTFVTLNIPAGQGANDPLEDGESLVVSFLLINSAGGTVFGPFSIGIDSGDTVYDDGAGSTFTVDLSDVVLGASLSNASVAGIQFRVQTASGAPAFDIAPFDANDESVDEVLAKDIIAPTLTQVLLDSDNNKVFLIFSEPMNTGSAGNNANQTVLASIDATDIQFDTTNNFDGTEAAPAGLSNPAFTDTERTTIEFDVAAGDIVVGRWLRPAFSDAATTSTNDFSDIANNNAGPAAAQIVELDDLEAVSAEFIETIPAGGGAVANALRVTFNNPLDPGDLGDTTFYNNLLRDGGASDMTVTGVSADPDDASSVLLTVTSNGDDGVAADGTDEDTADTFSINLDSDNGDVPTDIFGQAYDNAAGDEVAIGDGIIPSLAGGFGSAVFIDSNEDGSQDGFEVVFNEPLASASASLTGVTNKLNDNVTVHPFALIDLQTGERETATTDIGAGTGVISGMLVTRTSTDVNGNGTIDAREANNTLRFVLASAIDWDGDGNTGASDTDGEAVPTTDDSGVFNFEYEGDTGVIADSAGNRLDTDLDINSTIDGAGPIIRSVNFLTGDNMTGGMQKPSEQDGVVGDGADNIAQIIFSEEVNAGGIDETRFRFGSTASQRFASGDSQGVSGVDDNVLTLQDNDEGGFTPSSLLTLLGDNGVFDNSGNEAPIVSTGIAATNRTAPYVALQSDVNGNTIDSVFMIDTDADTFANRIDLYFTEPVAASTVQIEDFSVQGVTTAALAAANPTFTPTGNRISINLPPSTIAISSVVTVTYNGAADTTPLADSDGNEVAAMNDTFTARQVPTPTSNTQETAIMEITGAITTDGTNAVPAGTKVFAFIASPRANALRGTMGNLPFVLTSSSSMEALTNAFFGLKEFAYLYDDQGSMFVENFKFDDDQDSITFLTINATNIASVTVTGRGTTTPGGVDTAPVATSLTAGSMQMGWRLLGSNDGSVRSLYVDGVGRTPIFSAAVIGDDSGAFRLHVSAPVSAFNGLARLNAAGWPVIIVVELPTGERYAVSSLLNKVGGGGALTFNPNNRRQNTDGSAASATTFNINLANVGAQTVWGGWNLLAFPRQSGFSTAAAQNPVLPRSIDASEVVTGSTLPLATTLSQFAYFIDSNGDGVWTAADDDNDFFDSFIIDVNSIRHIAFTLNSRGVQVSSARGDGRTSNGITSLVGGYAVGFFNGDETFGPPSRIGVFQFGEPIVPGEIFTTAARFPNNNVTLGWALATNVAATSQTPVQFFTNNTLSDFLIEFNRVGHNEVNVTTSRRTNTSGTPTVEGDNTSVRTQGLFVHFRP